MCDIVGAKAPGLRSRHRLRSLFSAYFRLASEFIERMYLTYILTKCCLQRPPGRLSPRHHLRPFPHAETSHQPRRSRRPASRVAFFCGAQSHHSFLSRTPFLPPNPLALFERSASGCFVPLQATRDSGQACPGELALHGPPSTCGLCSNHKIRKALLRPSSTPASRPSPLFRARRPTRSPPSHTLRPNLLLPPTPARRSGLMLDSTGGKRKSGERRPPNDAGTRNGRS